MDVFCINCVDIHSIECIRNMTYIDSVDIHVKVKNNLQHLQYASTYIAFDMVEKS